MKFLIERQLLSFLQEWLDNYSLERQPAPFAPLQEQVSEKERLLQKVDTDLSTYRTQMERSYDLLERGIYTVEIFRQRQKTIQGMISNLETSHEEILSDMTHIRKLQAEQDDYLPKIRKLLETYHTNTPEANNRILKEVIDRMLYEKSEPNRRGGLNNCNFTLEVYPRLPT